MLKKIIKGAKLNLALVPLKKELAPLLDTLKQQDIEPHKFQNQGFWFYEYRALNIVLAVGGHGQENFTSSLLKSLNFLNKISHVYCLGTAGAIAPQLNTFDIICASSIVKYDSQCPNALVLSSIPIEMDFQKNQDQLDTIRDKNSLTFGPIAISKEDILSSGHAKAIHEKTGALAVCRESATLALSELKRDLPCSEIRVVTDLASKNTYEDFNKNLEPAMKKLGYLFIQKLGATKASPCTLKSSN